MQNQDKAPLSEALEKYQIQQPVRFHVPGHKGRGEGVLAPIYPYDVTELPGLDDLHHAEEAILMAQKLAAEAFGAEETFFLVGGSTVGNIAMIMAAVRPGDSILVQRNVHKSVIHGLILASAVPVYLKPEIDLKTGLPLTVSTQELKRMLDLTPQAKAVFLSNPNYYGMGMDLGPYVKLCNQYDLPLLVDEAHGAHFGFNEKLPSSAMQAGATAVVQSTHKMLGSLTMSSMLHLQGSKLDRQRIRQLLAMLQSSSPSYPLMTSLDLARKEVMTGGDRRLRRAIQLAQKLKNAIQKLDLPWLYVVEQGSFDYIDPLKITLHTSARDWNGYQIKEFLESRGIYPELAHASHVLLMLSMNITEEDLLRTINALSDLSANLDLEATHHPSVILFSEDVVLTPYEAFNSPLKTVAWQDAIGKVCGEVVAPYPPGIPALNPGERIHEGIFKYLQELKELGCRFHGVTDPTLESVKVIPPTAIRIGDQT